MKLLNNLTHASKDPPGTLKYTGAFHEKPKLELISYSKDSYLRKDIKNIGEVPKTDDVVWVNITGLDDAELINQVSETYNIHKIDLEDIVNVSLRSKIENKGHYLFSVFKMVYMPQSEIVHEHVSMMMLGNMLITFQETPGDVFDTVRERIKKSEGQIRTLGVDYLYYSLLDSLVDQYFDIIHMMSERFGEVETAVIEYNNNDMDDVYALRKELLYLKNSFEPIRTSLGEFTKAQPSFFSKEVQPYLNDVLDNVYQIYESLNTIREMVNSLYEMQVSNASNDMNKTITTLTIFSAIFIPLSFLTGIFGMNFISVPGLKSQWAFLIFIVFCVLIAVGMLIFFKRKKWF